MRLLVKVDGEDAMIVGYCPLDSEVHAVIITKGQITAVTLDKIELGRLPKQLRARVRKKVRKVRAIDHAAAAQLQ